MTAGMDAETGRVLSGWNHVCQSLGILFTTKIEERVMREWIGNPGLRLLGENLTPTTLMRFAFIVVMLIELYEPRFKPRRVLISGGADAARAGNIGFSILGDYRPRALSGDFTVEGSRTLFVAPSGRVIT